MQHNQSVVPGQILASIAPTTSDEDLQRSVQAINGRIISKIPGLGMVSVLIEVEPATASAALERLKADTNFLAVQFNGIAYL